MTIRLAIIHLRGILTLFYVYTALESKRCDATLRFDASKTTPPILACPRDLYFDAEWIIEWKMENRRITEDSLF